MRFLPTFLAAGLLAGAHSAAAQATPAQAPYRSHQALIEAVQRLARAHAPRASLVTIATSAGGRAVPALRVGAGATAATRPALLVVGNVSGPHLVGSEIALATAERLLDGYGKDSATTRLLDERTIWFVPRLNPDAAEALFRGPRQERTANDTPWDDDRDQATDEDGPDDLNGDGVITMLRIEDLAGEWIADPADPALLRRADPAKGERGRWLLVPEGRDDDGDHRFNEDGPGGTDINRNFSFSHRYLGPESGLAPVSSTEARGLLEFLFGHPEIAAVYVISPQDNLLRPWESRPGQGIGGATPGTSAGGPLGSIARADQDTYADVSRRFLRATGLSRGPASAATAGDLLSSIYYDYGRWSFGSRGWWVPEAPRDSAAGRGAPAASGADPIAEDRNALRWFRAQQVDAYVPWTRVTIPGESRPVEVGGFRPGVLLNPPAGAQLDSTLARQGRFIVELAGLLPAVQLDEPRVESLGEGVWRITADVINRGGLPTVSSIGQRLRNPRPIRLGLEPGPGTILSGRKVEMVGPLAAGASLRRSWTVTGVRGATLVLTAESAVTGAASRTITLR